mmetsp:Transcript_20076/g.76976  ORF Transcript_20076/g.76976 Transcript_20076/m.76976 type:complete len:345 (+) Transcript_20076:641-1675(+)
MRGAACSRSCFAARRVTGGCTGGLVAAPEDLRRRHGGRPIRPHHHLLLLFLLLDSRRPAGRGMPGARRSTRRPCGRRPEARSPAAGSPPNAHGAHHGVGPRLPLPVLRKVAAAPAGRAQGQDAGAGGRHAGRLRAAPQSRGPRRGGALRQRASDRRRGGAGTVGEPSSRRCARGGVGRPVTRQGQSRCWAPRSCGRGARRSGGRRRRQRRGRERRRTEPRPRERAQLQRGRPDCWRGCPAVAAPRRPPPDPARHGRCACRAGQPCRARRPARPAHWAGGTKRCNRAALPASASPQRERTASAASGCAGGHGLFLRCRAGGGGAAAARQSGCSGPLPGPGAEPHC